MPEIIEAGQSRLQSIKMANNTAAATGGKVNYENNASNPSCISGPSSSAVSMLNANFSDLNEQAWLQIGKLALNMEEWDRSLIAFESALRNNPTSQTALKHLARLLFEREQFFAAAELYQRLSAIPMVAEPNGTVMSMDEVNGELALCWLGMEDLNKSWLFLTKSIGKLESAESSSLEQKYPSTLWYALGVYFDRIGNEEAAIDAFSAHLLRLRSSSCAAGDGEQQEHRTREVYYRLGLLYRFGGKLKEARECFEHLRRRLQAPSQSKAGAVINPLGPGIVEVIMQLAGIDEAEGDLKGAKAVLERLIVELSQSGPAMSPLIRVRSLIPRIRQRLGCLALASAAPATTTLPLFESETVALAHILKATEEDPQDALNWYYLGRLYFTLNQPNKAYDAFQQAIYRDGRNAAFWNSIGRLYHSLGQLRDALDAYTRAVHHAPAQSAIWWNLGQLYAGCQGQQDDSREAFMKGLECCVKSGSLCDQRAALQLKFEEKLSGAIGATAEGAEELMELDAMRFVPRVLAMFPRINRLLRRSNSGGNPNVAAIHTQNNGIRRMTPVLQQQQHHQQAIQMHPHQLHQLQPRSTNTPNTRPPMMLPRGQ